MSPHDGTDDPAPAGIHIVEIESTAPQEQVWEVIWDLGRSAQWNRECVEATWMPGSAARSRMLQENMESGLRAVVKLAEAADRRGPSCR